MPYFRTDDGFLTHPKVTSMPRKDRAAAIGLWLSAGVWCQHHLTDGQVPEYMIEELCSTKKYADLLVRSGLWERTESGYAFHDFVPWQGSSRDEVLGKREAEAERKRKWREAKAAQRAGTDTHVPDVSQRDNRRTDTGTTPSVPAASAARPLLPIPPHPTPPHPVVPYGDYEDGLPRGENVQRADARASNDPPLCTRHAGQDRDSVPPCTACGRLREEWEANRDTGHTRPPLPPLCGHCDNRWIQPDDDGPAYRCPRCHPAALALIGA